jgi:drug/metabolite transporter (DMT)-like permease
MELAILLSLAASICTATSSICQRLGARHMEQAHNQGELSGFDALLVLRLARQPTWLLGFCCMLAGFALQISALHFGPLALVQPILAVELLFVFGYLALRFRTSQGGRLANWREWAAAIAMSAGIAVFLRAAAPTGGTQHAPALAWWISGLAALAGATITILAVRRGSTTRRAAGLGIATGIVWGFVAAVIKELSSRITDGPAAIFGSWSVYVLIVTGAAAMLLASHAISAGPLAASQPGFTIGDPVVAILLGTFLFREHLGTSPGAVIAQVTGLIVLAVGVWTLSGSRLITNAPHARPKPEAGDGASRERPGDRDEADAKTG